MAANDVQIRISARDFASNVLKDVSNNAQKTAYSMNSLGNSARNFVFNAGGIAAGIAGFQGLTAAIEGTANAVFNFSKSMETNEIGIAGILASMTQLNGRNLEWNQAIGISKSLMKQLNDEALKTAATSEEMITTFRALLGPGLGAGMKTDEIIQLSSVGVNAVKSLGLNSTQLVQELRDLVQGGIQPASSTLATALGLKDKDIKAAKASSEGLFNFLMERLEGFKLASEYTQNTFAGKLDQIQEGITRIGSEGTKPLFESTKSVLGEVASQFITINREANQVKLNEQLINDLTYASNKTLEFGQNVREMVEPIGTIAVPAMKMLGDTLVYAGENVKAIGVGFASWYAAGKIADIIAVTNGATQANTLLGRAILTARNGYRAQAIAAQETAAKEIQAATQASTVVRAEYNAIGAARKREQMIAQAAITAELAGWEALSIQLVNLKVEYMRLGASAEQAGIMQVQAARAAQNGNFLLTQQIIASQRAHLTAAAAAEASAVAAVSGSARAIGTIKTFATAVWALAGGWLGVAAATGYALYKLYDYIKNKNAIEEKDYNRANVRWNLEKQYWEVERAPDANHIFSWWDDATAAEAEFINISIQRRKEQEKEMEKSIYSGSEVKTEDLQAKFAPSGNDSAVKKVEKEREKYEKQAKEAQEETTALRNNIIDNTGQFLGRDYGGSSIDDWDKVCTTFIQSIWNAAGVANAEGLTAWAPNWKDNLGSAYHAADGGYQPLPGDAALIDYDGDGKADHVVMVDENQTGYYAASKPGTQSHHGKDLYGSFGKNIMGYGSASEYAGISPGAKAYGRERAAAFKEAYQLSREMQSGINTESETDYSQGMYRANQDILSKQHKIGKLKEQGVDTTELTKQLEAYSAAVKDKVTEKWQQSWQTLRDDTKKAQAEIIGDTTVFADAQHQATVSQLDHERKDRQNAVMQNKNDKVAAIAVDQWYNNQLVLAQQKRNSVYREEGLLKYNQRVEANTRLVLLEGKTQAEIDILNEQELKSKIFFLDIELQTANLKKDERIAIEKEKCDTIKELNEIAGRDMDNAVGVHLEGIRKQATNWTGVYDSAFSSIESSLLDNLNSMTNGAESFSSGFVNIFDNMAKEIQKIWIKMWYEQTILKPLTNWWGGILGGITGNTGGGVNLGSTQGTLLTGGMWGSGQSWTNPNGAYNFNSTPTPTPYFAKGGEHSGGWAVVGEEGPELAYFGNRAHIYDAKKSKNMLGTDTNKETPKITINLINKTGTEAKASATSKFDNLGNMIIQVIVDAIPQNKGGIQDMISAVSKSR